MATVQSYTPGTPPAGDTPQAVSFARYVFRELLGISKQFQEHNVLQLVVLHAEPEKPRDGMIVYADGTDWNPGFGAGHYGRRSGAWTKLFP